MTVKLTYAEYQKALEAGLSYGSACCCMGPQNGAEFCPCSMSILDALTDDGREALSAIWRKEEQERQALFEQEKVRWDKESKKYKDRILENRRSFFSRS